MKKKKEKITIADKALANAIKKGEVNIDMVPKNKKNKIKKVMKFTPKNELEKASKNKYKYSKRKVRHLSKNESLDKDEFKNIIKKIDDWDDPIKGGKAKNMKPRDFDIDKLSKGAEIQTEHTDDPNMAIDIAMDHLAEFDDYYNDENGLPSMEDELNKLNIDDIDDDNIDNDIDNDNIDIDIDDNIDKKILSFDTYNKTNNNNLDISDDDDFISYKEINFRLTPKNNDKQMKNVIKSFESFKQLNENDNDRKEPKMYPKENKFKRVIEYNDDVEDSLTEHNFSIKNNLNNDNNNGYIIFDLMDKSYTIIDDLPDDIRPCGLDEFDHIMNNL